jgi:hypothetical protein
MPLPLNQINGMPQVSEVLDGWESTIMLQVIKQTIDTDGVPQVTERNIMFKGTIQPLGAEEVRLKDEGQRSWEWLQIHVKSGSYNLIINDRIIYNNIVFKVMARRDYTLNGYVEYHVVRDYT